MKKVLISLIAIMATLISMVATVNAATAYDFETYVSTEDIKQFINTPTGGWDSLSIKSEKVAGRSNNYLAIEGVVQQVVTNITLKEGKNVISMRLKFGSGDGAQLLCIRGAGSSNYNAFTRVNTQVRFFHDSTKAVAYDPNTWYTLIMTVDTTTKEITETVLTGDGSAVKSRTESRVVDNANIAAGAKLRFQLLGTNGIYIDDVTVGDEFDKVYKVQEDFQQFDTGAAKQLNAVVAKKINLAVTNLANLTVEEDNGNKYLALAGSDAVAAPIIHSVPIYDGVQIFEVDMKVSPESYRSRIYMHKSGGATANLAQFYDTSLDVPEKVATVAFTKDKTEEDDSQYIYDGDLANTIREEFVRFTFVINKKADGMTVDSYANGKYYATANHSAVFTNIRFDVNAVVKEGKPASDTILYIDNIGYYTPGTLKTSVEIPEEITDGAVMKITSNNIFAQDVAKSLSLTDDGVVAVKGTDGEICYNVAMTNLKPAKEYTIAGELTDLNGQVASITEVFTTAQRKTDVSFMYNEEEIEKLCSGDIVVGVAANGNTAAWNGISVVAIYDSVGMLKDVKLVEHPDNAIKTVVLTAEENDSISVYRLEDLYTVKPIAQDISFNKDGIK